MPAGLVSFILAAIITLPVPLGHVVPGTAICLLALGLTVGDGVVGRSRGEGQGRRGEDMSARTAAICHRLRIRCRPIARR